MPPAIASTPVLALLLAMLGQLASGNRVTDCNITMTSPLGSQATQVATSGGLVIIPGSGAAITSTVTCSGDVEPFVVAMYAAELNHSVSFTFNGNTSQQLSLASVANQGDFDLASTDGHYALLSVGFAWNHANATLRVRAHVSNVSLSVSGDTLALDPAPPLQPLTDRLFSALRFDTVEQLLLHDSVFFDLSGVMSVVTFSDESPLNDPNAGYAQSNLAPGDAGANSGPTPNITIANSSFTQCNTQRGAFDMLPLNWVPSINLSVTGSNFTLVTANAVNGAALTVQSPANAPAPPTATAAVAIAGCRFVGNSAAAGAGTTTDGQPFTGNNGFWAKWLSGASAGAVSLTRASLNMSDCLFQGNTAAYAAGALGLYTTSQPGLSLRIASTRFVGNTAGQMCVYALDGCQEEGTYGGAVYVDNSVVLGVAGSVFDGNSVVGGAKGGAVFFGKLQSNLGAPSAAAAKSGHDFVVFQDTVFSNNGVQTTDSLGGALFDWASDGLTLSNCTFSNNSAGGGGALYGLWSSYLNVTGGSAFVGNSARSSNMAGGAIAVTDLLNYLSVQGASFVNNVCVMAPSTLNMQGGALWMERQLANNALPVNYPASISDAVFRANSCLSGGAVFISQVAHTIGPNVTFDSNLALDSAGIGGALYLYAANTLDNPSKLPNLQALKSNLTGVTFVGNRAQQLGGAVCYPEPVWDPRVTNCTFEGNNIFNWTGATSSNPKIGGAVYVASQWLAPLRLTAVNFTSNAASTGGGLYVDSNNVTMANCSFTGNMGSTAAGFRWTTAGSSAYQLSITSSNFTSNAASAYGGAFYVTGAGTVVSNARFVDNSAGIGGGAVFLDSCKPDALTAAYDDTAAGALYQPLPPSSATFQANQTVYIINSLFENNTGSVQGGALYASASSPVITNTTFRRNKSSHSGGAAYCSACPRFNVYGGLFDSNAAGDAGGALFSSSCHATFNATSFSGHAAASGGVAYAEVALADQTSASLSNGFYVLALTGCTASGSTASAGSGGCVSATAVRVNVSGGAWTGNSAAVAGGVLYAQGGNLAVQDVWNMSGNVAGGLGGGGAVYASGMLQLLISNSSISDNRAADSGGCLSVSDSACVVLLASNFSNCDSVGSGGAAWISVPTQQQPAGCPVALLQGTSAAASAGHRRSLLQESNDTGAGTGASLVMSGVGMTSNVAAGGGAVALQMLPNSSAVLQALAASGNSAGADAGGALLISSYSYPSLSLVTGSSLVSISGSSFSLNQALAGNGGAIDVSSASDALDLQVFIQGSSLTGNSAANGGGIALEGPGASLALQANNTLSNNTAQPPSSSGSNGGGSLGGCIYAQSCRALLVGGNARLSSCRAAAAGSGVSGGGAVASSSCQVLVLDGAAVSGSSASAGGGVCASDTAAVVLLGASLTGNSALGALEVGAAMPARADALTGAGGGLWLAGNTSALVYGSRLDGNRADMYGGAVAALVTCPAEASAAAAAAAATPGPLPAALPAFLAPYAPLLSALAARGRAGCRTLSLQRSSLRGNDAGGSGGGVFASGANSLEHASCADLSASPLPSPPILSSSVNSTFAPAYAAALLGLTVDSCPGLGNSAERGFGATFASLPAQLTLIEVTQTSSDPAQANNTLASVVPLARLTADNLLVLPATSPLTEATLRLSVTDASAQFVSDPWLNATLTVTLTTNTSDYHVLELHGPIVDNQIQASYDPATYEYVFTAISLQAIVASYYTLNFNMACSLANSGSAITTLSQAVYVPGCSDGEYSVLNNTVCVKCNGGTVAFSPAPGQPAAYCVPCPSAAECSGGAVLVPSALYWHSSAKSTDLSQCPNPDACNRDDATVAALQGCQQAWYQYEKLQGTMTDQEKLFYAVSVLNAYNCTLLDANSLSDPKAYLKLLCAEGYGGNLCAVCAPDGNGVNWAPRGSTFQCGPCRPQWQIICITLGLFLANLATIMMQILGALGEPMVTGTLQFSDVFSLAITHLQFLVTILKMNMNWPTSVSDLTHSASALTSLADQAVRVSTFACLGDGSPESQASFTVVGGLVIPLVLVCTACALWCIFYAVRGTQWFARRMASKEEEQAKEGEAKEGEGKKGKEGNAGTAVAEGKAWSLVTESKVWPLPLHAKKDEPSPSSPQGAPSTGWPGFDMSRAEGWPRFAAAEGREGGGRASAVAEATEEQDRAGAEGTAASGQQAAAAGGGSSQEEAAQGLGGAVQRPPSAVPAPAQRQRQPAALPGLLADDDPLLLHGDEEEDDVSHTTRPSPAVAPRSGLQRGASIPPPRASPQSRWADPTSSPTHGTAPSPPGSPFAASSSPALLLHRPCLPPGAVADELSCHDAQTLSTADASPLRPSVGRSSSQPVQRSDGSPPLRGRDSRTTPSALTLESCAAPSALRRQPLASLDGAAVAAAGSSAEGEPVPDAGPSDRVSPVMDGPEGAAAGARRSPANAPLTAMEPAGSRGVAGRDHLLRPASPRSTSATAWPGAFAGSSPAAGGVDDDGPPSPTPLSTGPSSAQQPTPTRLGAGRRALTGGIAGNFVNNTDAGSSGVSGAGAAAWPPSSSSSSAAACPPALSLSRAGERSSPKAWPGHFHSTLALHALGGGPLAKIDEDEPLQQPLDLGSMSRRSPPLFPDDGDDRSSSGSVGKDRFGRDSLTSGRYGDSGRFSGNSAIKGYPLDDGSTSPSPSGRLTGYSNDSSRLTGSTSGWFVPPELTDDKPEEEEQMGVLEKLAKMDKSMPLWQQLYCVIINASFVVYQGWASAALNVFACQPIDSGTVDGTTPAYYADFQQATAPNGYWLLNMNQACYQGQHLRRWTPVGVVLSVIICLGQPFLMFITVYVNRKQLNMPDVQFHYGWLYMRYAYNRVPYYATVAQLELLVVILVQVFSSALTSVVQQAALLQLTLLLCVLVNTVVWPTVNPLLVLLGFLSFSVLIMTVSLSILIGDGSIPISAAGATALGTLIVAINAAYIATLVAFTVTYLRKAMHRGFVTYNAKTWEVVSRVVKGGRDISRDIGRGSIQLIGYARSSSVKRLRSTMSLTKWRRPRRGAVRAEP